MKLTVKIQLAAVIIRTLAEHSFLLEKTLHQSQLQIIGWFSCQSSVEEYCGLIYRLPKHFGCVLFDSQQAGVRVYHKCHAKNVLPQTRSFTSSPLGL